ncbi:hypothetical protein HJG60_009441 [Phyllostomus discolor]|uniref:Uncharacterized protein n=1 Tax=Phyllostomus discolor TaxID=89673 RepID=A0A833YBY9_9CHIR|nr:hypothetical protein HJG60_009441 [Phyllostomus discolor]
MSRVATCIGCGPSPVQPPQPAPEDPCAHLATEPADPGAAARCRLRRGVSITLDDQEGASKVSPHGEVQPRVQDKQEPRQQADDRQLPRWGRWGCHTCEERQRDGETAAVRAGLWNQEQGPSSEEGPSGSSRAGFPGPAGSAEASASSRAVPRAGAAPWGPALQPQQKQLPVPGRLCPGRPSK